MANQPSSAVHPLKRIPHIHYGWFVVLATFLALLLAAGSRSTFGVFLVPLEREFSGNRAGVALIASLSILVNGANQPVIGYMLDRYGVRAIVTVCLAIVALGLWASSMVTALWQIYITFGLILSLAVGGPASTMATVVATRWFAKHRGLVMGVLMAGNSAGQVILIPVAMEWNLIYGWRATYVLLALLMAVLLVPIALIIRTDPSEIGEQPYGAGELSATARAQAQEEARRTPFTRALRARTFWMLSIGFFVCGFTGQGIVSTHFVAYTTLDRGIDPTIAATALGLAGGVSILGTIFTGFLTDHMGCKVPLASVYAIRGLAILFLITADEPFKLYLFAITYGLGSFATVPPTAALTARTFGRLSVGIIFGTIQAIHQIGGALGSYTGGLLFDLTGTYYSSFFMAAAFCFIASAAIISINELPFRRPSPAVAIP